jgi:hypothetical protein
MQEQASDMPPADRNAMAAQPGYDPYGSRPPPGQPIMTKPAKKRSLWWIGLVIAGAVTLTVIAVVAYYYATVTTKVYPVRLVTPEPSPRVDSSPRSFTLFRF